MIGCIFQNVFLCSETSCEGASHNTATGIVHTHIIYIYICVHISGVSRTQPIQLWRETQCHAGKSHWSGDGFYRGNCRISPSLSVCLSRWFSGQDGICEFCGELQWTHNNQGLLEDYMWICEHDARFMQKPQKPLSVKVTSMFVTQHDTPFANVGNLSPNILPLQHYFLPVFLDRYVRGIISEVLFMEEIRQTSWGW